jgi:hypothetical protein
VTLRPSRRRNLLRAVVALVVCAFGVGGIVAGAWPLGVVVLAIGLWVLAMAALVAFGPRAYRLDVDDRGFRVHDLFGRVVHDVRWPELVDLRVVGANAYSFLVVAWVCNPRRPKHGRWRWKRGTADDDGCMPDTYGMKADELARLMWSRRTAGAPSGGAATLTPF